MERVQWIDEESKIVLGIERKKGDRFEVSDDVAKQLISQGLVKDVYAEKKKDKKNKDK